MVVCLLFAVPSADGLHIYTLLHIKVQTKVHIYRVLKKKDQNGPENRESLQSISNKIKRQIGRLADKKPQTVQEPFPHLVKDVIL